MIKKNVRYIFLCFFIFIQNNLCAGQYFSANQVKTIFKNHALEITVPLLFFLWLSYTKIKKIVNDRALGPLKTFEALDAMEINNKRENYGGSNNAEMLLSYLWNYFLNLSGDIILSRLTLITQKKKEKYCSILEGFYGLVDMYKNEKYAIDTYYYPYLVFENENQCNRLFQQCVIDNNQNLWKMMIMLDENAQLHANVANKGIIEVLLEEKQYQNIHQLIDFARLYQKNKLLKAWVDNPYIADLEKNMQENKTDSLEQLFTTIKETKRYLGNDKNV